jgi:hypothetical protein
MKLNDTSKTVLTIAGVGLAGFIGYKVFKKIQERIELKRKLNLYGQAQTAYTVTTPAGQTVNATVNLATKAGEIYDALYNNDPFSWTEDETRAVNVVKTVPPALISQLEQTYAQLYSKDLRADLISFLDSDEYDKISYLFN